MTDPGRTYLEHCARYALAGWPCVLPVPPLEKAPPPSGYTGEHGKDTDQGDLLEFVRDYPGYSIALRMPDGVIGIDVDHYDKPKTLPDGTVEVIRKRGAETLADLEAKWGELPATWSSTSRGDENGPGHSRVLLFRVPAQRYVTKFTDIEIIQRHHRYLVVAPSSHEAGGTYTWFAPDGAASLEKVPSPFDLTELPQAWVDGLAEGASSPGLPASDPQSGYALLDQLEHDWRPECSHLTSARLTAIDRLNAADAGSRHDTMTSRVHDVVQTAAAGHTGAAYAITELRAAWDQLTAGEGRSGEFERMLHTSARKAVTAVGSVQVVRDPCLLEDAFLVAGAAPDDTEGNHGEGIDPGRYYSIREVIGAQAFDPLAQLDQPLGQAVLERTYPVVRYAADAGAWLLRVTDRWDTRGKDLSQWAVAEVAKLMPVGNPEAEKGSEEHTRHTRRARLMTQAGAKAVSSKMTALVAAGLHPCAVELADLDSQPHILWAGGYAFDLTAARVGVPVEEWISSLSPHTPHLHTAGVLPVRTETPLWDAFLEAVWPDPAIRAWALRVLSIAITGYADRALPILIGDTGRGKTQVVELLMSLLGSYAHAADARLLSPAGEKAHASIVFALKGRRLSFIDEGPREGRLAAERLKQLTGGGALTANQMNQNPITFRPTHTLVLTTNDEPVLTDPAIRSRARLIPCDGDPELVRTTRAAIGHTSGPAWRAEAPGVLAQMMAEAGEWLADPTTALVTAAPDSLRYLAENLGAEQDPIQVWLDEETDPSETGTPSRELYQAFVASCRRSGLRADAVPSETKWGRQLGRLGYPAVKAERHNVRKLVVRGGGFLPGMPALPSTGAVEKPGAPAGGLSPDPGGFLEGSTPNPPAVSPQVNPTNSVHPGGSGGFQDSLPYVHAHAHAHTRADDKLASTLQPVRETPEIPATQPSSPKPKREQTAAAKDKAAAQRAEKRQAAIDEASGRALELPAMVTRDGAVSGVWLSGAERLLQTLIDGGQAVTVDVETTGYPVGHRDFALRTIQLGNEHFAIVLDASEPEHRRVASHILETAVQLHAHSATADLVPLAHDGLIDLEHAWDRMHDTVVLAKLADPQSTGSDPGLKKLAAAMLGEAATSPSADEGRSALFKAGKWLTEVKATTPLERSGWANVDHRSETMIRYDASDVLDDAAIAHRLPQPPPAVLERERTAHRMTARVADRGLRLDPDHVRALHDAQSTALAEAAVRLTAFGIENPGSDQQVGAALEQLGAQLPRTRTGRPSVARGVLDAFKGADGDLGELVAARLAYQEAENRLGLFLDGYLQLIESGDGRARPTIYTLAADTGRMSCVRPNLQQVPREGGYRACITADPGHVLISADFSGVELRVAAALSQDANLMAIVADESRDIHREIAQVVWGPGAGKAERYQAKRKVFGRIYGSGINGLMTADPPVSEGIARAIVDALDTMTPGLSEWSRQVAGAIEAGRTEFVAYSGRTIYMPKDRGYAGPNYCIQGTARELLIDALMRWRETPWGEATLLPVHDELVVQVPEADAEAATAALVECMASELHGVAIIADPSEPTYAWADSV